LLQNYFPALNHSGSPAEPFMIRQNSKPVKPNSPDLSADQCRQAINEILNEEQQR